MNSWKYRRRSTKPHSLSLGNIGNKLIILKISKWSILLAFSAQARPGYNQVFDEGKFLLRDVVPLKMNRIND